VNRRQSIRSLAALGASLLLASAARGADTPGPLVAYGVVMTKGDPTKGEEPHQVPHPDLARIVTGRYGDKDLRTSVMVLSRDGDRLFAQMGDLPPTEVVFGQRPPPRAWLVVFTPDHNGRLVLAGWVVGDVGGELVPIP